MKFAVELEGSGPKGQRTGIELLIEQARAAEDLGYGVVFIPDHFVFEELGTVQHDHPVYELGFVLATLAQCTSTVTLASHVACVLFRHPAMLARMFAQLDEAARGRVIAGVGAGWTRAEFEMMGIPFPPVSERLRILDEAVAVMRGLWTEERFSFSGEHYELKDAVCLPKPFTKGGPKLMVGGSGAGIIRRAGQWADILHMVPQLGAAGTTTIAEVAKFTDAAVTKKLAKLREAEAAAGRPSGSVGFATTIYNFRLTKSPNETRVLAERLGGLFGIAPDEVTKCPELLIGTSEEMAEELLRRREAHGLAIVGVQAGDMETIRAFAEKVIAPLSSSRALAS